MRRELIHLVCVTLAAAALLPGPARAELVGWWKLDEMAGTVAEDFAGGDNDGTLASAGLTWHPGSGIFGGALENAATNSYVRFPMTGMSATNGSVALWGYLSTNQSADTRYFWGHTTIPVYNNRIQIYMDGSNTNLDVGLGNNHALRTDIATLETETWYHIALTWDGTRYAVYLDGAQVANGTYSGLESLNTVAEFHNNGSGNLDQGFFGLLDEVMIYNHALSLQEVQFIMNGGLRQTQKASIPNPPDEAVDVLRGTMLSWLPGQYAASHDVYFGTNLDDVTSADRDNPGGVLVRQGQDANSYDPPARLDLGQTYYWRIDEVNAAPDSTIYKGDVWSFTVEPVSYPVTGVTATASSQNKPDAGPERTVDGSGLNANDEHSTIAEDEWLSAKGPSAWIQYDLGKLCKLDKMQVWNSNQTMEFLFGFSAKDVKVEYSADAAEWMVLGDYEFARGPGSSTYVGDIFVDFAGATARYVKLTITSNWGGVFQQYSLSEVRFYHLPVAAREPSPADGATNVHPQVLLSWRPGREADSHQVYVSDDQQAVTEGTTVPVTVAGPSYDVALDLDGTYYWKVVEVNEAATPAAWDSDVWNFSTAHYVTVDDFDSYTNNSPTRVFQTWIDGAGFSSDAFLPNGNPGNGTGSLVGYDPTLGDVMEKVLVYAGTQSMPLYYDNGASPKVSEAQRTFAVPQDWSKHGITTLVLFFLGDPDNAAAPIYVKINDAKVPYNDGAAATTSMVWKQWNIPLASVASVDLKNVQTLTIGVGDGATGGSGTILVDEIRLYAAPPEVASVADPGTNGLAALYSFEDNVQDNSGRNLHGTANGGPGYVAGPAGEGKALAFDGVNDYVDLPIGSLIGTLGDSTFAGWVDYPNAGAAWQRVFDFGTGSTAYMFLSPDNGTTGTARFAIRTAAVEEQMATAPRAFPAGWHHLAVVIDSTSMTLQLYQDGTPVASGPTALLPKDLGTTTQNWLGRSQFTADPYLTGSVDEFRIYDRALSEAEIRYLAGDR